MGHRKQCFVSFKKCVVMRKLSTFVSEKILTEELLAQFLHQNNSESLCCLWKQILRCNLSEAEKLKLKERQC